MKSNIHPKWNHAAQVTCVCGAVFSTGSGQDNIQVDICSKCHPFFTGEMRFVDIQGRVDKFLSRQQAAQQKAGSKKKGKKGEDAVSKADQKSLKDMLNEEKKKIVAEETVTEAN